MLFSVVVFIWRSRLFTLRITELLVKVAKWGSLSWPDGSTSEEQGREGVSMQLLFCP